jgi:hypothetical protein
MRTGWVGLRAAAAVTVLVAALACSRVPKEGWIVETGYSYTVDDRGQRRTRVEALEEARYDAWLKILREAEAIEVGGGRPLCDYMAQNIVLGAQVRAAILLARQLKKRYTDEGTVEVTMGVKIDDLRRIYEEYGH